MRRFFTTLAIFALASPLSAQQRADTDPDDRVTGGGNFPAGWQARVDRDQPATDVRFMAMGDGFHATMGPAAVFYRTDWDMSSGDYAVSARFSQLKAPAHPEAYGIAIGGRDLAGPGQEYTYFLVRGTGEYFIATRKGEERTVQTNWTAHSAIQKQDAAGRQANVLGARVAGNDVIFTVNGQEVARKPRTEVSTDGIFGFRVNHNLDVHIDQITRGRR